MASILDSHIPLLYKQVPGYVQRISQLPDITILPFTSEYPTVSSPVTGVPNRTWEVGRGLLQKTRRGRDLSGLTATKFSMAMGFAKFVCGV